MATRGFTLLELLVAMTIFAIVGVMAMTGLNAAIGQQSQSRVVLDRLHGLQRAMRLMTGDLGEASPRYVRDTMGDLRQPPLQGDDVNLRLTRDGWQNPLARAPRGTIQLVQYRLEDGKLIREYWPVVDPTVNTDAVSEVLLEDVVSLQFEYSTDGATFESAWPPSRAGGPAPSAGQAFARPRAVRITLRLKDWGQVQRLVEVPG